MIAEIGHFALILAALCAIIQCVLPAIGVWKGWSNWMQLAPFAATMQCFLTLVSFISLTLAFVRSDFSVSLVYQNSHSAKPMIYKLTGVWGNHEGSMLLWVLVLSLFAYFIALFGTKLPFRLKSLTLSVQAAISSAFFAFILLTSNPFERLNPAPFEGTGLNPLLQDLGLAIHPPFLYMGYVGLSVSFSFALAALILKRVDAAWARWVRPWTLASWIFLTIGIALGSWWAYYELGWGGWWFWDPVENASFMPWLFASALLHSATVAEKRESLKNWSVLLAILAFSFSLIGTFLVRSGIITSVHAFANDPDRGLFILLILFVFSGGALLLYAFRGNYITPENAFAPISRETALIANNILLLVSAMVVFLGTFWPLLAELIFDRSLSVGPPFFEIAVTPFLVALAAILPLGASMPWKRGSAVSALKQMRTALFAALICGLIVLYFQQVSTWIAPIGLTLSVWIIGGVFTDIRNRIFPKSASTSVILHRLRGLPRSEWGKSFAHSGLAITIAGISSITAWETEDIRNATPGDQYQISSSYSLRFDQARNEQGPNYISTKGEFSLIRDNAPIQKLYPERRFYPVSSTSTTEAAIDMGFFRDIYVVIGDIHSDDSFTVKAYVKPLANWIWLGALVMSFGGLLSLTDRRYRIGRSHRQMAATQLSG